MFDARQSAVTEGEVGTQVNHRLGKRNEGRTIGRLNPPPPGSFFVDNVLTECSLGSCASGAYKQKCLGEIDVKPQRSHHL